MQTRNGIVYWDGTELTDQIRKQAATMETEDLWEKIADSIDWDEHLEQRPWYKVYCDELKKRKAADNVRL